MIDEYHHILVNTRIQFANDGQMNPIFLMGSQEKPILSTGHRSNETTKFLTDYMQDAVSIQINRSVVSVIGEEQVYNVDVVATEAVSLQQEALKLIE